MAAESMMLPTVLMEEAAAKVSRALKALPVLGVWDTKERLPR